MALLGLLAGLFVATSPARADNIGNEGCTPGYWKNHQNNWYETATMKIPTGTLLNSKYVGFKTSPTFKEDSLLDALKYNGGNTLLGAERNLLRAAAAAWLNAAHEGVGYPYRRNQAPYNIVKTVNDAIASNSRAKMLQVAGELDAANNLGCPL